MKFRECTAGYPIALYRQPYGKKEILEIGSTPHGRFSVVSHGSIVYDGNSFKDAEAALVKSCASSHGKDELQTGRYIIGKHSLKK